MNQNNAGIITTAPKLDIETELNRHDIKFSWKEGILLVPEDKKNLVLSILQGLENRGVITPGSFGRHIKGK